nr:F0F1 ATP synthase subunit B [Buchnera aphidicola]
MKYIWPPIISAIKTRQKEIKQSLINSRKAQDELCILQKKIDQNIIEAKEKASNILNEANKQKVLILEEAKKNALEESKKILANTQSEIEIAIIHARKNLHKEVVDLSILMAEKIIKKNVSKDENQNLLDELVLFLSQVKN